MSEQKQFALTTRSESGDDYLYFIKSETKPTDSELGEFLLKHGNDVYEGKSYEYVTYCCEITDEQFTSLKD